MAASTILAVPMILLYFFGQKYFMQSGSALTASNNRRDVEMSKTIVAIIGCGTIAKSAHIPAYLANPVAEIKYFCDIRKERAEQAVEKYGCGIAIEDYRVILDDPDIEAVSICTRTIATPRSRSTACVQGSMCSARSRPPARTRKRWRCRRHSMRPDDAEYRRRESVQHGVNMMKQMIEDGELGELYHVYVSFRAHRSIPGLGGDFTNKAVAGGGALIDWGVHFLDIVMYCAGDPEPQTVTGQTYCKLGKDMKNYAYLNMWAGPPNYEGTYDVDDFVTAMIRTTGPSITVNGAWRKYRGRRDVYRLPGDKAGIRLQYGAEFTIYGAKHGALLESTPKFTKTDHFRNEINSSSPASSRASGCRPILIRSS